MSSAVWGMFVVQLRREGEWLFMLVCRNGKINIVSKVPKIKKGRVIGPSGSLPGTTASNWTNPIISTEVRPTAG